MAKQNFLGGGYIGKLGQTVGQRWKDQKIVRTYVKPANPNTPAQQNARAMFATANKLAQQAMNINGHTGVWDTSTCPEYSQRVGQAMRRLRAGYTEQQSLPLYPEGSLPEVNTTLQNYVYDVDNQTVTFTVNDYGISEPTAVEISFYSPLAFLDGKYTEHIIHGTADSTAKTFTIDISNNNTTDDATARNAFIEYMEFGFLSMYPTFYDMLGAPLPEIRLSRAYTLNNTLYDFNKDLPLIQTQGKVTFTPTIQNDLITASALPPVENGYPFITKGTTEFQYWQNKAGNEDESSFITVADATGANFTLDATPTALYLKSSSSEFFYLQSGTAGKQMYKDVSTAQYENPFKEVTITDVYFSAAGNTLDFVMDDTSVIPTGYSIKYDIESFYVNARNEGIRKVSGTFTRYSSTIWQTADTFETDRYRTLVLYADVYAVNPQGVRDTSISFIMSEVDTAKIITVMSPPEERDRQLIMDLYPVDIARTHAKRFTANPMVGAGNKLFVAFTLELPDGTLPDPWIYDVTTSDPARVWDFTEAVPRTWETGDYWIVDTAEFYYEDGVKKVAWNKTRVATQKEFIGTTNFNPNTDTTISIQWEEHLSNMISQVEGTLSYVYDVSFGEWATLKKEYITATDGADFTIDWRASEPDGWDAFIAEPKFTAYDKYDREITGIYVSARQQNENSTIYINSKLTETHILLENAYYMGSTSTTFDIRYEPAGIFSGNVRVRTGVEITDADTDVVMGQITGENATVVNSSTIRITADVYDNSTPNTPVYNIPPAIVTGSGYNSRVCTWE